MMKDYVRAGMTCVHLFFDAVAKADGAKQLGYLRLAEVLVHWSFVVPCCCFNHGPVTINTVFPLVTETLLDGVGDSQCTVAFIVIDQVVLLVVPLSILVVVIHEREIGRP